LTEFPHIGEGKAMRNAFRKLFLPSERLVALAMLRILLASVVLFKIVSLWPSHEFVFGEATLFDEPSSTTRILFVIPAKFVWDHAMAFYCIYSVAAIAMAFGIGRNFGALAVYVCTEVSQHMTWLLCDGGDNLLKFSLLYLVAADSFSVLSFNRSLPRSGYSVRNLLTNVAVALLIGHLCLVYLASGLSKAHAEVWYNGTALYYIMNGERFEGTKYNELLGNSAIFCVLGSYGTIILESVFGFAVFVPRLRIPTLIAGAMMHIGIFLFMMIHEFQAIYMFHYFLFFRDSELRGYAHRIQAMFSREDAPPLAVQSA
jgi:hypothetical protein